MTRRHDYFIVKTIHEAEDGFDKCAKFVVDSYTPDPDRPWHVQDDVKVDLRNKTEKMARDVMEAVVESGKNKAHIRYYLCQVLPAGRNGQ